MVSRPDDERTRIGAAEAAFWEAGEWHETGSDGGLVALVIESPHLAAGKHLGPVRSQPRDRDR
jgi:hypothetical protein